MKLLNLCAGALLPLALVMPAGVLADPLPGVPADDPKLDTKAQQKAPTAFADAKPIPVLNWGVDDGRSLWVPAGDILMFDIVLNLLNRQISGTDDYNVTFGTISKHLKGAWAYDNDPFGVNQFGHPYQGSMYHGFARSAGLGYWEASAYTILGSALWEIAGEDTTPSINDQFTTGFGGSFLGEPLFRMASLLLESGEAGAKPGFWREFGAAALSPSTGFNRWAYGDRFDGVFRSHNPAAYTRIALGYGVKSTFKTNVTGPGGVEPQSYQNGEVVGDFTLGYGLPGKAGYTYDRPFDYFHFQFTAASSNVFENVITRGLLYGTDYGIGKDYRGVWGLYGSYDYIAPQIFRISTTAFGLGTTGQAWLSRTVALQHTVLASVGYGSAGTINGVGLRDYHHGVTPQGLLALRLIFSDRLSFDVTGRDYFVSSVASGESGSHETIQRADAQLTLRVFNLHGIALKYVVSRRDAHYENPATCSPCAASDTHQSVGAFSIGYAYLGQTRSGAVDWRPKAEGGPGSGP